MIRFAIVTALVVTALLFAGCAGRGKAISPAPEDEADVKAELRKGEGVSPGKAEAIRNNGGKVTLPDPEVRALVCKSLLQTRQAEIAGLGIVVSKGRVVVRGTVANHQQKALVERIVRTTPGVAGAAVSLRLKSPPATSTFRGDKRPIGQITSDVTVRDGVRRKLAKSPHVSISGVRVEVYDGVVLLTGYVRYENQKKIAGEISLFSGGVRSVVNHLTVTGNDG